VSVSTGDGGRPHTKPRARQLFLRRRTVGPAIAHFEESLRLDPATRRARGGNLEAARGSLDAAGRGPVAPPGPCASCPPWFRWRRSSRSAKRRGLYSSRSEITAAPARAGTGPLGVELKNKIKRSVVARLRPAGARGHCSPSTPRSSCTASVWKAERPVGPLHDPMVELPRNAVNRFPGRSARGRPPWVPTCPATKGAKTSQRSGRGGRDPLPARTRTLCPDAGKGEADAPRQVST